MGNQNSFKTTLVLKYLDVILVAAGQAVPARAKPVKMHVHGCSALALFLIGAMVMDSLNFQRVLLSPGSRAVGKQIQVDLRQGGGLRQDGLQLRKQGLAWH